MVDDESRVKSISHRSSPGSHLGGGLARILQQFRGESLSHVGPEFPPRLRFENRKLEQAAVSSLSSSECDEVL